MKTYNAFIKSAYVTGYTIHKPCCILFGQISASNSHDFLPSFGGEVKPLVPCSRFAARKRSLNLRGSRNLGKITGHLSRPHFHLSRRCGRTGTWRRKWERLKVEESNGKLPPRTCPGCSVPEPHRSHDWVLVPASPASKAEY